MFFSQQTLDCGPSPASTGQGSPVGARTLAFTYRILTRSVLAIGCASLIAGCSKTTAGQNRRGAGPSVAIQTTATKRITVQRQVDLAGTLLSPDQAKVSAEAAGVVRSVLVEIGREVQVGDPLVKIEPRELALALARAESALRQTRAQLGMPDPLAGGDAPPPDDEIGSVKNALANRDEARANAERAKTLSARGLISPVDLQAADTRLKVAEAAYQSAVDTVARAEGAAAGPPRRLRPGREEARRRRGARADRRRRLGASGPCRRVHRRAHAGRRRSSRSIR